MQLQYSRAFGGKDLKPFGLSAVPSIRQVLLNGDHVGLVVCSDGISDVGGPEECAAIVGAAWARGEDPAEALVQWAIVQRQREGIGADNVTAVVVQF
jgi:protein phosphatase